MDSGNISSEAEARAGTVETPVLTDTSKDVTVVLELPTPICFLLSTKPSENLGFGWIRIGFQIAPHLEGKCKVASLAPQLLDDP